jgi:hypothetical protein
VPKPRTREKRKNYGLNPSNHLFVAAGVRPPQSEASHLADGMANRQGNPRNVAGEWHAPPPGLGGWKLPFTAGEDACRYNRWQRPNAPANTALARLLHLAYFAAR